MTTSRMIDKDVEIYAYWTSRGISYGVNNPICTRRDFVPMERPDDPQKQIDALNNILDGLAHSISHERRS